VGITPFHILRSSAVLRKKEDRPVPAVQKEQIRLLSHRAGGILSDQISPLFFLRKKRKRGK
jgi:hypothetical protein